MRHLPGVELFPTPLIDDMHKAFDAVCAKLRLAHTADKATELVARKVVELAKAGHRGDDLTGETLRFFEPAKADLR
jgi:hypothetical protein